MSAELVAFLSRHIEVSEVLAAVLLKSELVRRFPKGSFLLREGEVARKAYFILSGCVRSYVLKDGEDRTVDFFIEENAVLPLGYGKAIPSEHFLECLEDTVAVVSSPDQEERMLAEYPELKEVCLAMSEVMAEKLQANLARYRTSSPQERYVDLAKRRPDLLQRIPQYQIASYLGVKPESLSRIHRRRNLHNRPPLAQGEPLTLRLPSSNLTGLQEVRINRMEEKNPKANRSKMHLPNYSDFS